MSRYRGGGRLPFLPIVAAGAALTIGLLVLLLPREEERLPNREEELRRIEEDIALSEGEDAYSGFVGRNSGIHNFWIKGSGNRRLLLLMENLNDVLLHDRNMSAMDEKRREEIIAEHREIFRAVRVLDREGARAALTRHMENGYQYSLKIRNQED